MSDTNKPQRLSKLLLASASPRRRDLLHQLLPGVELVINPAAIDEGQLGRETGEDLVLRLAIAKAHRILSDLAADQKQMPLLAADTEVVLDGEPLGKPENTEAAVTLLKRLAGRSHAVKTGLALVEGDTWLTEVVTTQVVFRELDDDEIRAYAATGEPNDKAGGYAIQGRGAALVERIEGSYTNVVGLPLEKLSQLLKQLGYRVF